MNVIRITLLCLIACLLASCATAVPYQKADQLQSGYVSKRSVGDLYKITFLGNSYNTIKQVKIYTLVRAAQLGLQLKKPYFALYKSLSDAAAKLKATEPSVDLTFYEPKAYAFVQYHLKKQWGDMSASKICHQYTYIVNC